MPQSLEAAFARIDAIGPRGGRESDEARRARIAADLAADHERNAREAKEREFARARGERNRQKLDAKVTRWIAAGEAEARIAKLDKLIADLGRDDLPTPPSMIGIGVFDLMAAQRRLRDAVAAQAEAA